MRAVVQRVIESNVTVDEEKIGEIKNGLMILLGVGENDIDNDLKWIADKIMNLRIFEDSNDKMNLSILDVEGEILVVPQFTLYGDCRKGRRPSFASSANPEKGEIFFKNFIHYIKDKYNIDVQTGKFQSHMVVHLKNDGPVTLLLDSEKNF